MVSTANKTLVTIRIPSKVADEVRRLVERDDESQSTVLRRLIKSGLTVERRSLHPDEAA